MGINFKSHRIQAARDRLHLKGRHELTFREKVKAILEILGLCYSPRSLSWCRRYAAELRDANPNMTPEQLQLFAVLEDRILKKREMIAIRQAKKTAKAVPRKHGPKSVQPAQTRTATEDVVKLWEEKS